LDVGPDLAGPRARRAHGAGLRAGVRVRLPAHRHAGVHARTTVHRARALARDRRRGRVRGAARAGRAGRGVGIPRGPAGAGRRAFVVAIALLLVLALNLEFAGFIGPAGWLRALAALASTQLAWKLWQLPGRRDRLSWAIWSAGWCVAAGFTAAAMWPIHRVEA